MEEFMEFFDAFIKDLSERNARRFMDFLDENPNVIEDIQEAIVKYHEGVLCQYQSFDNEE